MEAHSVFNFKKVVVITLLTSTLSLFITKSNANPKNSSNENTYYFVIGTSIGKIAIRPEVKNFRYLKDQHVIKQQMDFSCGSAALATIFNYYLGEHLSEKEIIDGLFKVGNVRAIIKRRGFSLLDMKRFAEAKGYKAAGYKTDLEGLIKLGKPAIVTIVLGNYKHFVVFRGIKKGRVFLADPALGNVTIDIEKFKQIWYRNIALVIFNPNEAEVPNMLKISELDGIWVKEETKRQLINSQIPLLMRHFSEF